MKLIAEICIDPDVECEQFRLRQTARAILLNEDGFIAVIYDANPDFHILAGGAVDEGETIEDGLRRECLEEVGANIEILGEVGMILEQRNTQKIYQVSRCFVVRQVGELVAASPEAGEQIAGQTVEWMTVEDAIATIEKELTKEYSPVWASYLDGAIHPEEGKPFDDHMRWIEFLKYKACCVRELAFLREYQTNLLNCSM